MKEHSITWALMVYPICTPYISHDPGYTSYISGRLPMLKLLNMPFAWLIIILFMKQQPIGDLQIQRNTRTNAYLEAGTLTREICRILFVNI